MVTPKTLRHRDLATLEHILVAAVAGGQHCTHTLESISAALGFATYEVAAALESACGKHRLFRDGPALVFRSQALAAIWEEINRLEVQALRDFYLDRATPDAFAEVFREVAVRLAEIEADFAADPCSAALHARCEVIRAHLLAHRVVIAHLLPESAAGDGSER